MNDKRPAPYPLRMPERLRESLDTAATKSGRSLHSEIVRRLENSVLSDQRQKRDLGEVEELFENRDEVYETMEDLERRVKELEGNVEYILVSVNSGPP